MKLVKHLANLGYGSRKQVAMMFREGRITDAHGEVLYADDKRADDKAEHEQIRVDGEPLDPPTGMLIMLHKPIGYTCSTKDQGQLIYELLPPRFRLRSPVVSSIGRLDRDTSGLLLMTDDGVLLHRISSPKHKLAKIYEVTLARELRGDEGPLFASGKMMLESEKEPLAPAHLEIINSKQARVTVTEGRYHQVRRMFAAVGNHVEALHRSQVGGLTLGDLMVAEWKMLDEQERRTLFGIESPQPSQPE